MREIKDQELEAIAGARFRDLDGNQYFAPREGIPFRHSASMPEPEDPPSGGNLGFWTVARENIEDDGGNAGMGPA